MCYGATINVVYLASVYMHVFYTSVFYFYKRKGFMLCQLLLINKILLAELVLL